jgi:hypothetical protein
MVDYSAAQISASRYLTDNLAKDGNNPTKALMSGPTKAPTNALSFDPNIPVDTSAVEQMKGLLSNGNVRLLRSFLIGRFDELRDLARFNMMLLSAGPALAEHSVNMDVILKGINEFPVIRLNDSKGDFCVVRFDRQPKR